MFIFDPNYIKLIPYWSKLQQLQDYDGKQQNNECLYCVSSGAGSQVSPLNSYTPVLIHRLRRSQIVEDSGEI